MGWARKINSFHLRLDGNEVGSILFVLFFYKLNRVLYFVVALARPSSLVMCSTGAVGVDDDDHEKEDSNEERIEIGQPTDVPHVSHITYVFLLVFY